MCKTKEEHIIVLDLYFLNFLTNNILLISFILTTLIEVAEAWNSTSHVQVKIVAKWLLVKSLLFVMAGNKEKYQINGVGGGESKENY